jgi:hypothetical protein
MSDGATDWLKVALAILTPQTEVCPRCLEFDDVHDQNCPNHPDYDPTPWCGGCGARKRSDCHCGPIAEND